ncbi:hypothetical protein [Naasia sp. SYSU D00057]|uniref:hypothetical protein n=1 Tax=Naasia sp. SYSU D00057 TaxID=2817380 RepID=UPI001B304147|nr:hypothetical protein [Naasia sp. SYSU D00057]
MARIVSPTEYGAFALAFTIYSLVVAVGQALTGQVAVIRYSGATSGMRGSVVAAAGGAAITIGGVAALVVLACASFLGMPLSTVLVATAVALPALTLQDFVRTVLIAFGTPARAFFNDLLWTGLWATAFAVLFVVGVDVVVPFVIGWGASAVLAAAVGMWQAGAAPAPLKAVTWVRLHWDTAVPLLANAFVVMGALQVAFLLIAAIGALEDVGALRAAQTLLGPLNILGFAASSFAVPEIVRGNFGRRGLLYVAVSMSAVLVIVTGVWGGLLMLLPDFVGAEILGATWQGAREVLPGLIIYSAAIAATSGATAVMRALDRPRSALLVSILLGPSVVLFSLLGVIWAGAVGAAIGFAVGAAVVIPPCWVLLMRDVRQGRRGDRI